MSQKFEPIIFPLYLELRAMITAMMLNGELNWSRGIALKALSNEQLIKLYESVTEIT